MNIELALAASQPSQKDAKECAKLVEIALKRLRSVAITMEGNSPQALASKKQIDAEMTLLDAVFQSLRGNHVDLRIYTH